MYKNVGYIYLFNMLIVGLTNTMWQSYLSSNICLHRAQTLYRALHRELLCSSTFTYLDDLPMFTNVITLW